MEVLRKRIMVGVNTKNGLGHIVALNVAMDEGHHLTSVMPVSQLFNLPNGERADCKFSYFNKFSNNTIFREID